MPTMTYQPPAQLLEILQKIEYEEALPAGDPRYVDTQEARGSQRTFSRLAKKFGWDPSSDAFFAPLEKHVLFFGHGGHLLWVNYWMWAAVIMAFSCLAILIPPKLRTHPTLMPIALIMLVAASWIDKGLGLLVGGFTPNMFETITPYMPTAKEIAVALGVYAVGALVLSLLWRIALGVKKEVNHLAD